MPYIEKHLDNLQSIAQWGYPLVGGLIVAYLYAPTTIQNALFGLPPQHAATALWIGLLIIFVLMLGTLASIDVECRNDTSPTAREAIVTLRSYPLFANPFYETSANPWFVTNATGLVVIIVPLLLLSVLAIELFYTFTMPVMMTNSVPSMAMIISYFAGQIALIVGTCLGFQVYRKLKALMHRISSTESVARQKERALVVASFVGIAVYTPCLIWRLAASLEVTPMQFSP